MGDIVHFLSALALSFIFLTSVQAIPATSQRFSRQTTAKSGLEWIKKWAAVGDSYAAGIGAGDRIDYWCSRYDRSYPSVINANGRMSGTQTFEYKACSGAKSPDVEGQVKSLSNDQNAITLSSGGNDVGLVDLLNECIYTWNPRKGCAATIADSKAKIQNELPGNLDKLYSATKGKLASGGIAYVTAYARFFDETSTDCDKVSWHWYPWPVNWLSWQYLDVQRRKDMNELVDLVNAALRDAVGRAGSQFVFVEYDSYFGRLQGRYCLPNVQEPSPNRADLLFYLDGTDEGSGKLQQRQDADPDTFPPHTFEGQIQALIDAGNQNITQSDPDSASLISVPVSDKWARVFHPLQNGHSIIAGKVLYHMAVTGSTTPSGKEVTAFPDSCPNLSLPLPLPPNKEPSCGAELGWNFPSEFQLLDKKAPISEIFYRMRDQACQGLCENIAGVPGNLLAAQRQGDNGCEYAVKLSSRKEAYFYVTGSGSNCYDATEKMIHSCMTLSDGKNAIHDSSWINGPNPGEFFQIGIRDLNGEGSHHAGLTTTSTDHLGYMHIACHREDQAVADGFVVDISGWDDGNWGKSIQKAVKECGLAMTGWQYESGTDHTFEDGTNSDHWASFSVPWSNGGCVESKIEKAVGLRGGGLDCPFGAAKEVDLFA